MKIRNTKQKELIQKEIEKFNVFFTAEDIYNNVKKINKNIGLATIYRYLNSLKKSRTIHSYKCENRLIYSKEKESHCHFTCEETGEVIHFDIDSLDFLKDKIPGSIISFQIEVRGICKKCSKD